MFLTTHELAERWLTTEGYLRKRRCIGQGPEYCKIGNKVRYLLESVESMERTKTNVNYKKGITDNETKS